MRTMGGVASRSLAKFCGRHHTGKRTIYRWPSGRAGPFALGSVGQRLVARSLTLTFARARPAWPILFS
jgi:hypothetical protein